MSNGKNIGSGRSDYDKESPSNNKIASTRNTEFPSTVNIACCPSKSFVPKRKRKLAFSL